MPSLVESAHMLDALSGDSERDYLGLRAEYRAKAASNPDNWKWSIAEAKRRKKPPHA